MPKATTKAKKPKAKRTVAPAAPQSSQNDLYAVRLTMAGEVYEAQAETITEALEAIRPHSFKGYGFFHIIQGKRAAERRLLPIEVKKLMRNKVMRQIFDKRMNLMLK